MRFMLSVALVLLLGSAHGRTVIRDEVGVRVIEDDAPQPEANTRRLQTSELQALLDRHNSDRATTAAGNTPGQPGATSMPALKWDDGLAQVAQAYANKCIWGHNSARTSDYKGTNGALAGSYVGENLYASSQTGRASTIVPNAGKSWYDEYVDYTYSTKQCAAGKMCGHYTQVVWAKTTLLGCAYKECTSGLSGISWSQGTIVVCNYAVGGNNGGFPYVSSGSGGQTPKPTAKPTQRPTQPTTQAQPTSKQPTAKAPTVKPPTPVAQPVAPPTDCDKTTNRGSGYFYCRGTNAGNADYELAITQVTPPTISCVTVKKTDGGWEKLDFTIHKISGWFSDYNAWVGGVCQKVLDNGAVSAGGSGASQTQPSPNKVTQGQTSEGSPGSSSTDKPNVGAIVGGVLGGFCLVMLCAGACMMMMKRKNQGQSQYEMMQEQQGNYQPPSTQPMIS